MMHRVSAAPTFVAWQSEGTGLWLVGGAPFSATGIGRCPAEF
jgi:hypothetical protein